MKNLNEEMWTDNDIYEIKFGGVNGISFRVGQRLNIKRTERKITSIIRDFDKFDEEIFMVFSAADEGGRDEKLTKYSKGEKVYITFDV